MSHSYRGVLKGKKSELMVMMMPWLVLNLKEEGFQGVHCEYGKSARQQEISENHIGKY